MKEKLKLTHFMYSMRYMSSASTNTNSSGAVDGRFRHGYVSAIMGRHYYSCLIGTKIQDS